MQPPSDIPDTTVHTRCHTSPHTPSSKPHSSMQRSTPASNEKNNLLQQRWMSTKASAALAVAAAAAAAACCASQAGNSNKRAADEEHTHSRTQSYTATPIAAMQAVKKSTVTQSYDWRWASVHTCLQHGTPARRLSHHCAAVSNALESTAGFMQTHKGR